MALPNTPVGVVNTVGRALAATTRSPDGTQVSGVRVGRYGEQYMLSLVPDLNQIADEGLFFVANNGQTGVATAAAPTAFSATNPFVVIQNTDAVGGKRIYLDDITLICTAAGTAGASIQMAVTVDNTLRYTSGGTVLTPANCNMDEGGKSIATCAIGNITAASASASARTIVGNRFLKGAIGVVGDEFILKFAGVDATAYLNLQNSISKVGVALPPVIIGPGQSLLVHIWLPSQSAASSYLVEANWWER